LEEKGPSAQGPPGITVERSAKMGSPLNLTIWVEDDAKLSTSSGAPPRNLGPPVTIRWSKYRGPGTVRFDNEQPVVEKLAGGTPGVHFAGKAGTTATFSAPGDYILHVVLNDYSGDGGGGFQCCWTSGKVNVKVAPEKDDMLKKRIWSLFAPLIVFSISMDARAEARGQGRRTLHNMAGYEGCG